MTHEQRMLLLNFLVFGASFASLILISFIVLTIFSFTLASFL